jgi:hypothetical protein
MPNGIISDIFSCLLFLFNGISLAIAFSLLRFTFLASRFI